MSIVNEELNVKVRETALNCVRRGRNTAELPPT